MHVVSRDVARLTMCWIHVVAAFGAGNDTSAVAHLFGDNHDYIALGFGLGSIGNGGTMGQGSSPHSSTLRILPKLDWSLEWSLPCPSNKRCAIGPSRFII